MIYIAWLVYCDVNIICRVYSRLAAFGNNGVKILGATTSEGGI